jgi:RNA polymerase sigma-70 factor (ECF subfamily)
MNLFFCLIALIKESLELSDAEIINSVLAGNQEDFTLLVERYQGLIFSYLFRFLYDQNNAQDIAQDVFLKVYKNLRKIDTNKPLKPWLYRIAHNEALNFLRYHKKRDGFQLEDREWDNMGERTSNQQEGDEQLGEIRTALNSLKPKYREVIVLHFFEEKSYNDISVILNIPKSTVGVLINRAKKQIIKIVNPALNRRTL